MYKEQARMLGLANRLVARIGKNWVAEPYPIGALVTGPDCARITIETISADALQITFKPVTALDTTYSFTALWAWGSDKIIEVLIRDYLPEYRKLLADRLEERSGAQEWAEDTQDAMVQIGETLSISPRVWKEGHDGEPKLVYASYDVGEVGEVSVDAAHRGEINVRLKTRDIEVLRVLIPVLATYNKPDRYQEISVVPERKAAALVAQLESMEAAT